MTPLDQLEKQRDGDGDGLHSDLAQPSQEPFDPPLASSLELAVPETGGVEEVVEADSPLPRLCHMMREPSSAQRGEHVRGPAATDIITGKFSEDLDNGEALKLVKQLVVKVGGDAESHRLVLLCPPGAAADRR